MRGILLVISLFLFFGCSVKKPPITEYRIIANNKTLKSSLKSCKNKSIKIAQAFSQNSLMSVNMDYALSSNKIFSYSQSQWSETPNRAISAEILKHIRDSELFKYAQSYKTRSNSDLVLETTIGEFLQYYNEELSKSEVKVVISFNLIDIKTNEVIAAKTFKVKKETKSNDAKGGSEALNEALGDILSETILWLGSVCK